MKFTNWVPWLCMALLATDTSAVWASKPGAPIQLSMTTSAPPTAGAEVDVVLSATPLMSGVKMDMDVVVPKAVIVVSGVPHWSGDVPTPSPQKLTLRIRVPAEGLFRIQGIATITHQGAAFSAHQLLEVGTAPPNPNKAVVDSSKGVVRPTGRGGERVIEFPVK